MHTKRFLVKGVNWFLMQTLSVSGLVNVAFSNQSVHADGIVFRCLRRGTCVDCYDHRFYYDFYNEETKMTDADLKKIKKEMDKIIRQKLPLVREEVTRQVQRYTRIRALC